MAAFTPTGVEFIAKGLNQYLGGLKKANTAQTGLGDSASGLATKFGGFGKTLLGIGAIAGGAALAGVTALGGGIALTTGIAISFESAFTGVLKTTDGLTDSMGNLNVAGTELRQGFTDLSKEVPIAFEELAAIGELGGQLGIGKDALLDFTSTIANLGVTTNLTTEEAASSLARFQNIFGVTAEDMGQNTQKLGSTLVDLGNNFATTERDILSMGLRLAGAGNIAGFSQEQILGLAAALSSVGISAEAGGTATQKVLLAINNAVNGATTGFVDNTKAIDKNVTKLTTLNAQLVRAEAQTGLTGDQILQMRDDFIAAGGTAEAFGRQLGDTQRQKLFTAALAIRNLTDETKLLRDSQGKPIDSSQLAKFAQIAGVSATEFEKAWQEDAAGAFQLFVEGLGREGDNAQQVLENLGLADQQLVRAFLSLSNAGDLLERSLDTSSKAFKENNALAKEAQQRYATTESQLLILKNTLRAVADTIGSKFLPIINRFVQVGKTLIEEWADPFGDILDTVVIPAIDNLIDSVLNLFDSFQGGTVLQDLFDVETLAELISTITADLPGMLEKIVLVVTQFFIDKSETVKQAVLDFLGVDTFQELFNNIVTAIPEQMTGIVTSVTTFIETQVPVIQEKLQEWATVFLGWIETAATELSNKLGVLIAAIGVWVLSGDTQQQLSDLGESLGEAIVTGIEFLLENQEAIAKIMLKLAGALLAGAAAIAGLLIIIGGQIVAGILAGILESLGAGEFEVATFSELSSILTGIADQAFTIAKLIGIDIILGISQGILDTIDKLTETLNQIGFIITSTISEQLGIESPSTVFFDVGLNIVQGLIDGILSLLPQVGEILAGLFGGLLGNGDGEDTASVIDFTATLEALNVLLPEATATFIELFNSQMVIGQQSVMALDLVVLKLNSSLMMITNSTLPALQSTTLSVVAAMITQIKKLIASFAAAKTSVEELGSSIKDLKGPLEAAIKLAAKLARRLSSAAGAAGGIGLALGAGSGIGLNQGVGFANGLGLGATVPGTGNRDTFGPVFLTPGEEVLIAPKSTSIDEIIAGRLGPQQITVNMSVTINNQADFEITRNQVARLIPELIAGDL